MVCGCSEGKGSEVAPIIGLFEDWGVGFECPVCKKHWVLCSKCPSRQKMIKKRQVYDHWQHKHKVSTQTGSFSASNIDEDVVLVVHETPTNAATIDQAIEMDENSTSSGAGFAMVDDNDEDC